jgi:cytidine deaminase
MNDQAEKQLICAAIAARERAYAPYSKFRVGAAVWCDDGQVVAGCNVENASLGLSICAERAAACAAISGGHKSFQALAIAATPLAPPCGACRQFLAEFNPQMEVVSMDPASGQQQRWRLSELLPESFRLDPQ